MVSHANLAMNYVNMKECNYQFYNEYFRIKYRENKRMSEEIFFLKINRCNGKHRCQEAVYYRNGGNST